MARKPRLIPGRPIILIFRTLRLDQLTPPPQQTKWRPKRPSSSPTRLIPAGKSCVYGRTLSRSFGVRAPHRTAANSLSRRRPARTGGAIRHAFGAVHSACPSVTVSSMKRRSFAAPIRSAGRSPSFPEPRYDIHSKVLSVMCAAFVDGAPAPALFAMHRPPRSRRHRAEASLQPRFAPRRPSVDRSREWMNWELMG